MSKSFAGIGELAISSRDSIRNTFNRGTQKALRHEIQHPKGFCAGPYEWEVE